MTTAETRVSVLACDLDETLVSVNTFPHFVRFAARHLAARGPRTSLARLAWGTIVRKVFRGSHLGYKGVVDTVAHDIDPRTLRAWAIELYSSHQQAHVVREVENWTGPRVLCTAAPEVYAREIGDLAGFDVVMGSRWDGGRYVENVSAEKVRRLGMEDLGSIGLAISDDAELDRPLLLAADVALVVDGHAITRFA